MKKVIAYVHSHWDREWYREFEDFRLRLIEVFDEVLGALSKNEIPCFYFDGQTAALEDYLEIHPEKEQEIKKLLKAKKLRIGPFYCSADSFLSSGECLYRNLEIGINKSKEFGETEFLGYLSDTFGHSQAIPYLLKAFDIDKACLWRGLGDLKADLDWQGINVTYLIQGYFQDFLNQNWSIEQKAEALKKYLDKIALKSSDNILLPIGADHLGIAKKLNNQIKELNKIYKDYEIEIKTPFEYFEKITKRQKVEGEFLNNKLNFILPGVYSSRIYLKQANANSQWLLTRVAEPLQAITHFYFNGKNKQNEIDYTFKTLIKNHAHDSIYGCSIDKVHDEVMQRFEKVDSVSNGVIKRTLRDLSSENGDLSIINLSNFDYSGTVKIKTEKKLPKWLNVKKIGSKKGFTDSKLYNTNEIPITEDYTNIYEYLVDVKNLPAFSITKLEEKHICKENYLKITPCSIENEHIKFEVKNGKVILADKKTKEVYKDFIVLTDRKDNGDSYNFGAVKGDKPFHIKLTKVKLKEANSHRAILNLKFNQFSLDVILYNQSETLEFEAKWNNKKKNHLLQIGFNLKEKITTTNSEDLFGTVQRSFNPDYDIYKELPAPRGIELKPNTAPMQRFVKTQNFALFTKGNCEYEINKNMLYLTLLRATGIISNPKNSTRGTPAGPPLETPKLQGLGENSAQFAISFENEELNLFKKADEFYSCTQPVFSNIENTKFIDIKDKSLLVYAIKTTKEGLLVRLFNNSERTKTYKNTKIKPKEIKNIIIKK